MVSRPAHRLSPSDSASNPVNEFEGVMGRLKAVIAEENELLNRGLPATLLDTTERKRQLSNEYGARGDELVEGAAGQILSDAALQERLLAATAQLYAMSEENRKLLSAALAATRRRVDRVMDAIRTCPDAEDDIPQPQAR